jgi:FlaA1/EpsC-like NDP-sugar epimerase
MMTRREAASLTIATLRFAEANRLFMLDMGEPINILGLAHALIRSRGLRPGSDIEIVFTGLRPGEILTEQLIADDETWRTTVHDSILEVVSTKPSASQEVVRVMIDRIRVLAQEQRAAAVVGALRTASHIGGSTQLIDEHVAEALHSSAR